MDTLLPEWCDGLNDLPFVLFEALSTATLYLGWEELPVDDRPPRRIWTQPERLKSWFDEVDSRRQREIKGERIEGDVSHNEAAEDLLIDDG